MDWTKPVVKPIKAKEGKVEDKPSSQFNTAKPRCTTYNTCKTEDKCEYELTNTDKKCILKYEFSWCKKNIGQIFRHQE